MTASPSVQLPDEQRQLLDRSRKLAWLSIGLLTSAAGFMALTLGRSQAMKTAWISDLLSLIPPIALLVAMRFELRSPTRQFPFGYSRAISVSFLATSSVLTLFGLTLFIDAAMKLVAGERPPIGTLVVAGHQIWAGWLMIAALAYSLACGFVIGKLKEPVAAKLHDKALHAEAKMNRDEWMSEGAAIAGLLLVAFGRWWGDAVSAALISLMIIRDGWSSVKEVIKDLMDEAPTTLGEQGLDELPAKVSQAAERMEWVARAQVRLREHGRMITGDVLVVPRDDADLTRRIARAAEELTALDWRLHALVVMPVPALDPPGRP
jgi:cation diffusion facilitator family transporter